MKKECKVQTMVFLLMAFMLPGIVWCLVWFAIGGYPFGDKSIMIWDMQQQYVDFFQYYKKILDGDMSILYSFAKSLGGNNIALFSYYLSSPFNILLLFFEDIPLFIFTITGLKFCFCGLTAFIYFKKRFKLVDKLYLLILSCCYALMAFNVLQASNIMWLDGAIYLPLLLLSVDYLLRNEKKYLLSVFVAISILSNWYSAYMAILFTSLYFLVCVFKKVVDYGWRGTIKKIVEYGMLCLLGIGISAVLFLPTISSLLLGKGNVNSEDFLLDFREPFYQIIQGNVIGKLGNSNQLNLFCGSIILVLVISYFFNRNITVKERIINGILLGLLIFSANFIPLENIWNGFRKVASYYCRFSFVVIMFLILIAGKNIEKGAGSLRSLLITLFIVFICFFLNYKENKVYILATILFVVVEGFLYFYSYRKIENNKGNSLLWILTSIVLIELTANMYICYNKMYTEDLGGYFSYIKESNNTVQEIKNNDKNVFYRIEGSRHRSQYSFSENLAYNVNGIAHYSSGLDQCSSDLLQTLGYCQTNRMPIYWQPILPSDSLFGIKYLMSDTDIQGMEKITEGVYYNPYALSLGVFSRNADIDLKENSNPFLVQNKLFSELLGEKTEIFVPVDFITINDYQWEIKSQKDAVIYGYIQMSGERALNLFVNGNDKGNYTVWSSMKVFNVDIMENSEKATVELRGYYTKDTRTKAVFYQLDMKEFKRVIQKLKSEEFVPETMIDGKVSGEYIAKEDGYLLLSILYDEGWNLKVNGKEQNIEEFANSLIRIPVHKGVNKIEMTYTAKGVKEGGIISLLTFVALCVYIYIDKRRANVI